MKSALIVFAKKPEIGKVKTRLTTEFTPQEATELYTAFLQDALEMYKALPADVRLYVAPPDEMPSHLVPQGISTHVQKGKDLGERMLMAFVETFAAGYENAIIIGTDHPTLPTFFIEMGFDMLRKPFQIVIGGSEDGGYYLLGMNEFYPVLFEDMTYSHDAVFDMTFERATTSDAQVVLLPTWYDIDTPADVKRMIGELEVCENQLPRTRTFIQSLVEIYPDLA